MASADVEEMWLAAEEQILLLEAQIRNVRTLCVILPPSIATMIDNALKGY